MLELIRRWGPYLLTASAAFFGVGFVPYINGYILASVLTWCLAFLCFIGAVYSFFYDFKKARRKDREDQDKDSRPNWPK